MTRWRYGLTLRPLSQLNLNRLGFVDESWESGQFADFRQFGTAAFNRELTPFEVNQLDLVFIQREDDPEK